MKLTERDVVFGFVIVWFVLALIAFAIPARAQSANCGPHENIVAYLASKYSEARMSIALDAQQRVLEIFANIETGSWTAVLTAPGGVSCFVASGESYQYLNDPLPVQGEEG